MLECYSQLQAEGFLTSRSGSATRVAVSSTAPLELPIQRPPAHRPAVDFRPGVPDLTSFPWRDWTWALREACRDATPSDLGYGDPGGTDTLRAVLAAYLRRVRGTVGPAERIVICGGFGQGINLALAALAQRGIWRVAIEDPGDNDYHAICRQLGMEAIPVEIDERGIDVEALANSGVRAVVLTPTHQFPTGSALAPERRNALISWANDHGAIVIEDDYDAELRYDRAPVGALQGLAPDRVLLIGSVSKSLAPALRLGWIVAPAWLLDVVTENKRLSDRASPALDQLALAALIESGRYDKHLRHMRRIYAARRQALVASLSKAAPGVSLRGLAAGFHAVADLREGADEQAIIEEARERSIGLYGMGAYRPSGRTGPPQLVLGFGNLSESAIERGIGAIGDLL